MGSKRATTQTSRVRSVRSDPPCVSSGKPLTSTSSSVCVATPVASRTRKSSLKRKRDDANNDQPCTFTSTSKQSKKGSAKQESQNEEKRLQRFRAQAPKSFLEKLIRAQTQRMIVIGRTRSGSDMSLREDIDIVGSTGNIYRVTIGRLPTCTCPDSQKGNECKHKVYALHTVLKAPEHLQYQRALLTTELTQIFDGSPSIPTDINESEGMDGKRKPIEGECPICYMEFDEDNNEIVWCKAACGNNMHKTCFEQWAASQRGKTVKCVYCRTDWHMEKSEVDKIQKAGSLTEEGYINVAEQFGLSRARDHSSYYQPWVRRTFGYGG